MINVSNKTYHSLSHQSWWRKSGAGFTLLELLITIAISGILTAMMFTNFSKEKDRNNLKAAVRQVQVDLQATQNKAQAGVTLSGFSVVPTGHGFVPLTSISYKLFANTLVCTDGVTPCDDNTDCGAQTCLSTTAEKEPVTRTLPGAGDVTISPSSGLNILFTKPNGKAVFNPPASPTTLYLKSDRLKICYAITVTAYVGTVSSRQITTYATCP